MTPLFTSLACSRDCDSISAGPASGDIKWALEALHTGAVLKIAVCPCPIAAGSCVGMLCEMANGQVRTQGTMFWPTIAHTPVDRFQEAYEQNPGHLWQPA
jgi:hypothetical protein